MSKCKPAEENIYFLKGVSDVVSWKIPVPGIDPLGYSIELGPIEVTILDDETPESPVQEIDGNVLVVFPIDTSQFTDSKIIGWAKSNTKEAGKYHELKLIAHICNTLDEI